MSPTGRGFPTFAAGDRLAERFRVVGFLGAGAVGEVYEVEDEALGGRVAIKALRPELAADADAAARLHRELHLTRAVTHPNVCRTYDGFVDATGRPFLTMELLDGEPLDAHLERCGRLPPAEACEVLRQIADGLAAAHAAGVIHRDLKTGNVFVVGQGVERRVVVTDFGLAHSALAGGVSISRTGELVGSPAYMAPEQVRGEPVGPATDVYALGIVAYELVTGELPFRGESGFVTAVKRLTEPPPPPRGVVPELAPVWDEAILRCLATDPADRFADARELPRWLAKAGGAAAGDRAGTGIRRAGRRWRARGAVAAAAAGLALLAVAAWESRPWRHGDATAQVSAAGAAVADPAAAVAGPPAGGPGGDEARGHAPPAEASAAAAAAPAADSAGERAMAAGADHFRGGRIAEARAAFEEALSAWRGEEHLDRRAAALGNLANTYAIEGRLEEATPYYEESLELFRRLGDDALLSRSIERSGRHLFRLGDFAAARVHFEDALALARRGGRHGEAARLLVTLALVLRQQGDGEQAERALAAAIAHYREAGEPAWVAATERSLGDLLRHRGRLGEAGELLDRALTAARESGDEMGEAATRVALARTLYALGRPAAGEHLARAEEIWRLRGSRAARARTAVEAASWSLDAGDPAAARARLLPALADLEEIGGNEGLHEALGVLSDLLRQEGDPAAAREAGVRALALARELGLEAAAASGLLRLARLALDDGLPVEAIALARSAAAELSRLGEVDGARDAALLLATARLQSGDAAGARRDLLASGAAESEAVRVRWRAELVAVRLAALAGDAAAEAELARLEAEASRRGWALLAGEAAAAHAVVVASMTVP